MSAKIIFDEQVTFVTDPVTRTYLIWTIKDRATAKDSLMMTLPLRLAVDDGNRNFR